MTKKIYKSYRYALRPTKEQLTLLKKHFGSVRYVFNHFLASKQEQYKQDKKSDNYTKQAAALTQLKKQADKQWLKEVNSQSLQTALRHLDRAFVNFFNGKAKYPRFKKKHAKNSFTVPQFVKVVGNRLYIPKFKGGIKLILHRPVQGRIKHCTLTQTPTGKLFVSILCEVVYQVLPSSQQAVGLDLGLKDFAVFSNENKAANHKYLKRYEQQLAKAQRRLSKKQKKSTCLGRWFFKRKIDIFLLSEGTFYAA
jgi:putative transposase